MVVREYLMDRYILLQSLVKEGIRQSRKHPPVVMQKAGGAFGNGQAARQIVARKVLENETRVIEDKLREGRAPQEHAKNFAVRFDMPEAAPQHTSQQG